MNHIKMQTYSILQDSGDAEFRIYEVFSGVRLIYVSVHLDSLCLDGCPEAIMGQLIEIHHCLEGCVEQTYEDEIFYLTSGDLALGIRKEQNRTYQFPTGHYHGCTILVDMTCAPQCFSEFLEDVCVQPMEVAKRLCGKRNSFYIRKQKIVDHIFSELYTVPESLKKGYLKVKVMELLLILSTVKSDTNEISKHILPQPQVELAKQGTKYLLKNIDQRITITELAKQLNVSETTIKNAFKAVYDVPVYSYIRMQKMHIAAQRLVQGDHTVSEIAFDLGYKNTSKFSDAFREILGETPSEYRENHKRRIQSQ